MHLDPNGSGLRAGTASQEPPFHGEVHGVDPVHSPERQPDPLDQPLDGRLAPSEFGGDSARVGSKCEPAQNLNLIAVSSPHPTGEA